MKKSSRLAAKAGNDNWLSLYQHLTDTAGVMKQLFSEFVTPSMVNASGLSLEKIKNIAVFTAAVHDIGKATAAFQQKMCDALPWLKNEIADIGFDVARGDLTQYSPHALAGASILNYIFGINESICEIVAAHHGKPRDEARETKFSYQMTHYTGNYYSASSEDSYKGVWTEILEEAKTKADISEITDISVQAQMIISGLLVMADWIASNEDFFPLFEEFDSDPNPDRLNIGMKALGLPPSMNFNNSFMNAELFRTRFDFEPNDMQKRVIEIANNMTDPGIMIIEAPMGLGKTEAALSAAEIESCTAGTGGIFFGLPTRGTANGMFSRVEKWASIVSEGEDISIGLSHGSASFNQLYMELKTRTYDDDRDEISVNSWMAGKYRTLLPDFVTGTVDQALFAALKRKFIMLLHLGLAGKTVIIDEVHSYDDYMSEYMFSMLSWMGTYKVPVILLSATLTKEKRNSFVKAYTGKDVQEDSDAYPSVTWSDGKEIHVKPIECKDINTMEVMIKYAAEEDAAALIGKALSDGGCAGVILDTVGGAQDMYESLKTNLSGEYTLVLLHSRFLPEDRSEIEDKVLSLVGKNSIGRNKIVIVGTQVLEQSLDLDFDIMFTEKCPVDLLFQRLGRLHRHKRNDRPDMVKKPVCYIFNDENACKMATYPYDQYIIRRTDECIEKLKALNIPDNIRKLTEDVYNIMIGSDEEDKCKYIKKKMELESNAKSFLLPEAEKCKFKGMLYRNVKGAGTVRSGINKIDVILLKKTDEGVSTFSGCTVKKENMPTKEETFEIIKNKISLQYDDDLEQEAELAEEAVAYEKTFRVWRRNPFFEREFFVLTDVDGRTSLGKHTYYYSKEYGWRKES